MAGMTCGPRGRKSVRAVTSTLLAATLALTACTHRNDKDAADQPPIPFTGLTKDLRIRWSAEPGIDLLTGPAVIVRAYRESYVLGGRMANPAFYYPGFEQAVPFNSDGPNSLIRPLVAGDRYLDQDGFRTTSPTIGTWREHVLSLTGDPKIGYTAKVCAWDYATAALQPDGKYRYAYWPLPKPPDFPNPYDGTHVYRITLSPPPPSEPNPANRPQRGTAPSPSGDVFGGWKVLTSLHMDTEFWSGEPNTWPRAEYRRDQQTCIDKAPDPFEKRRVYLEGEHPRDDFPTPPAEPGWPAAGT